MDDHLFTGLARALEQAGRAEPTLVVDRDRLDGNLKRLAVAGTPTPRLAVKSLPSLALLDHCMTALGSRRLMSFHRPFLQQLLQVYDDVDILMGKPLPAAAVAQVVEAVPASRVEQVQWLVDSGARLDGLQKIAKLKNLRLRVNVEINVGLQRGGLDDPAELARLERRVLESPRQLQFSGLMGYDAHAAKAPPLPGAVARAVARSQRRYRQFISVLRTDPASLTLNGAGSPTHTRHTGASPLNEISVGSVLLKPTDFDLPDLDGYLPALWIATPVLKRSRGVAIPFLPHFARRLSATGPLARDSLFIYGGRWMARPAWPGGMRTSRLYGLSSNQQLMTVPAASPAGIDDWVFFRPTQSEAVMLQFGDIRVVAGGRTLECWPTLRNE